MRHVAPLSVLASVLSAVVVAGVVAGCSAETLDPAPPLVRRNVGGEVPLLKPGPDRLPPPATALSCGERRAESELYVTRALSAANRPCETDAECVAFAAETGCFATCTQAVAESQLDAVRTAVTHAEARWCEPYPAQCGTPEAPDRCPPMEPRCVSGRCVGR